VHGTANIVASCLRHATPRLVHVSSIGILDHAGRDLSAPVTETSPLEPRPAARGAYTRTKLEAEATVQAAIRDKALPAVVLRPGQIFGPGAQDVTPNGVVGLAGRWLAVGDGRRTIPLVFVDDVVDALLAAAAKPDAVGRTFHVVDPDAVSRDAYLARYQRWRGRHRPIHAMPGWLFYTLACGVEAIGRLVGREVPLTRYRVRSLRPLDGIVTTAAREGLGWSPRMGLQRGLDQTFGSVSDGGALGDARAPTLGRDHGSPP
jgi:nucleoside-diphosphate-sugar epimerase